MLLAAILCYCGYRNGIKKEQWRKVNPRTSVFGTHNPQCGAGKWRHVAKSAQVISGQALALRLNECSLGRILHQGLHYHPYKIQVAQELSARDKSSGLCFRANSFYRFGYITWPARSPDIVLPTYFLWGYFKSKVYETRPANIDDLKHRILECIQRIPKEMPQRVITAFPSPLQECTERHGGQLQSVIFRQ